MNSFTNIKKQNIKKFNNKKDKIIFKNYNLLVINDDDKNIIEYFKDTIYILPYFVDEGTILLQLKDINSYKLRNSNDIHLKNIQEYLTCINFNFTPSTNIQKEVNYYLKEYVGIRLNDFYQFNIEGGFFFNDYLTSKIYISLIELPINSYTRQKINNNNNNIKYIKIDLKDINKIKSYDIGTKILINQLKNFLN